MFSLDRADVEISERKDELHVLGKGNKERKLQLNAEVRRAIPKYLEERADSHSAFIFK